MTIEQTLINEKVNKTTTEQEEVHTASNWVREEVDSLINNTLPYIVLVKVNWINQEIQITQEELENISVSLNLDTSNWEETILFWEKVKTNPKWDIYQYTEWRKKWQLMFSYDSFSKLRPDWAEWVEMIRLIHSKLKKS